MGTGRTLGLLLHAIVHPVIPTANEGYRSGLRAARNLVVIAGKRSISSVFGILEQLNGGT